MTTSEPVEAGPIEPITTEPVLLPYQQAFVDDPARVKLVNHARRTGMSFTAAYAAILALAAEPKLRAYVVAPPHSDEGAEFIRKATELATEMGEQRVLGRLREVWPVVEKVKKAARGDAPLFIFDAAGHGHTELNALLAVAYTTLPWGGRVWVLGTDDDKESEFAKLVAGVGDDKRFTYHRVTYGRALKEGLYKRQCAASEAAWSEAAEQAWKRQLSSAYDTAAALAELHLGDEAEAAEFASA